MKTASDLFSAADRERVEAAIGRAEKMTSGEIVPVVATVSGRYDRAEDLFGVVFACVLLAVAWAGFQGTTEAAWSGGQTTVLGLTAVLVIVLVGFVAGATLATYFPALRLPFISKNEMVVEVERAARATFQAQSVRSTAAGTGILIYVSLYERVVKVIGDDAVAAEIPQQDWDAICRSVVEGMKRGKPTDGLVDGLQKAGELLAQLLPGDSDNANELHNQLILLD
jgi:putative membrane protein